MASEARILIEKTARRLILSAAGGERVYPVALGKNWASDKAVEGDYATPLGEFYVCAKNPLSKFFLSLRLSYPNAEDAERGLAGGLISAAEHAQILEAIRRGRMPPQRTPLGGEICIHGRAESHGDDGPKDWTRGCIALDNAGMRALYDEVAIGTPVIIVE